MIVVLVEANSSYSARSFSGSSALVASSTSNPPHRLLTSLPASGDDLDDLLEQPHITSA
jgi:hypothetical protein